MNQKSFCYACAGISPTRFQERQVAEMVNERGLDVHHTTVFRWVQQYGPELDKRYPTGSRSRLRRETLQRALSHRPHLKPTNDSWRVDETYILRERRRQIPVSGSRFGWQYPGLFIDSETGCARRAKRFFRKTLQATHAQDPRVINVDKNAAYPKAIDELIAKEELSEQVELRQNKYLNNIVEQDHRGIKRLFKPGMGFGSFNTDRRTLRGYEIMNMMRKGQIKNVEKGAVTERIEFINQIFGVAA